MLNVHAMPYHHWGTDKNWFAEIRAAGGEQFHKVVWSAMPPFSGDVPEGTIYVFRNYVFDDPGGEYRHLLSTDPERLAALHVEACVKASKWLEDRGIPKGCQLFTSVNEPHIWSTETPRNLAVYGAGFFTGLHAYDLNGGWPEFSVGWPGNGKNAALQDPNSPDLPKWDWAAQAIGAMRPGDYLTVHEYWADGGAREMWGGWGGRVLHCPYNVPILITEAGIDMGVKYPNLPYYKGWLALDGTTDAKAQRFTDELWDYMGLMRQDPRIQGIFPFSYDGAGDTWAWFEQRNQQLQDAHRRKWRAEGIPQAQEFHWGPKPVEQAWGVDLSHHKPSVDLGKLKDMGATFVALRISGPKKRSDGTLDKSVCVKDPTFDRYYAEAVDLGLVPFGFHYLVRDVDFQAKICREAIGDKHLAEVFCDAEEGNLDRDRINRFCMAMDAKLGRTVGYYGNSFQFSAWGIGGWIGDRPFWAAAPWDGPVGFGPKWLLRQDKLITVDGVKLDHNLFNGTEVDLRERYGGVEPEPKPDPEPQPEFKVEYRPGGPYIIGNYPKPGQALMIKDPWGNAQLVHAGDKPEYGPGGFLFNCYVLAEFLLLAEGKNYKVPMKAGMTAWVSWKDSIS